MVTAEITISRERLLRLNHPVEYAGIKWETYEEISEEIGESRALQLAYYKGILTVMPTSELHEFLILLLERYISIVSLSTKINIVATGKATMRSKRKRIGIEPDLSFFVRKANSHKIKRFVESEISDPPDIVVEIDITHRSDDKFPIYADLGISEFWQYDGERLMMFLLMEGVRYDLVDRSRELPILTGEVLTEFLNRGQAEEDQLKLLTDLQDWLQNAK